MKLYHYLSHAKLEQIQLELILKPSAPFNSNISDKMWEDYSQSFNFPVQKQYTFAFFEPEPKSFVEHGLFDVLMEEFSGGDYLLELYVSKDGLLVRDHSFHSPKEYRMLPEDWKQEKNRKAMNSLKQHWYNSTIPLEKYNNNFVCPEVLIPYDINIGQMKLIQ